MTAELGMCGASSITLLKAVHALPALWRLVKSAYNEEQPLTFNFFFASFVLDDVSLIARYSLVCDQ